MYEGFIKVATCSPQLRPADCAGNTEKIIEKSKELAQKGVSLAVFPELCITGYTCDDLFMQDTLLDAAVESLHKIADSTVLYDITVIVGLPLEVHSKLYNVAAVICNNMVVGIVPKINIPNYGEFYEARQFTSGKNIISEEVNLFGYDIPFGCNLIFKCRDLSFGCEICEDLWAVESPSVKLATSGAEIICNLSASNEVIGKADYRKTLVKAQSGKLICGYIYANAGFGESTQDKVFSGHSLIAENGSILCESKPFDADTAITDIDLLKLRHERRFTSTFPYNESFCKEVSFFYNFDNAELTRKINPYPFVPQDENELSNRCNEILNIQATGLATRLNAIGKNCKAVIGLSGGLDSTLALIATVHAFDILKRPHNEIICITMPGFGTTDRTYKNACKLAEKFGTELREISIADSVRQHFKDINHDESVHDVTYENSQARERTQILMDVANEVGGIVVGTGDLSELALGWATYNADHMSMYGVNCSIPKTLVRYIVNYEAENTTGDLSETLKDILDTPVSPELLPPTGNGQISQKTENIVGPYDLHDFFLYYTQRYGFTPQRIYNLACFAFKDKFDSETILKWEKVFYKRFFSQQFKRSCLPDGPKVGTVTLSPRGDWRMPSDASSNEWLKSF